jgi:hypothetical protein
LVKLRAFSQPLEFSSPSSIFFQNSHFRVHRLHPPLLDHFLIIFLFLIDLLARRAKIDFDEGLFPKNSFGQLPFISSSQAFRNKGNPTKSSCSKMGGFLLASNIDSRLREERKASQRKGTEK